MKGREKWSLILFSGLQKYVLLVPPSLAFLAVSSGERDVLEPPCARMSSPLIEGLDGGQRNRLHRPHPVNSTINMAMSICFQIVYECFHLQEQSWKVARKILQPTKLDLHLWLGHLQKIFVDLPDLSSGRRNINWEFLALFYSRFWLSLLWFFLWDFLCHYSERA